MPLNIPLPNTQDWGDYSSILQNILQNREIPPRIALMQAQAKQAQAEAQKGGAIANLLQKAFPSNQTNSNTQQPPATASPYTLTDKDQSAIQNLKPGDSYQIPSVAPSNGATSQQQSAPSQPDSTPQSGADQQAMDWLYRLGVLKQTPGEKAELDKKTAYAKSLGKNDAKILSTWDDYTSNSEEVETPLENLMNIQANPAFQAMYKNPEYLGYDIKYLKRLGTPEQVDLLGQYGSNLKSLYSSMGQQFKGAFREFEKNIYDQALPLDTDPFAAQVAKTKTLLSLKKLITARYNLAENIARSSEGKISPSAALQIADKQINSKQVAKQIEDQFTQLQKQYKQSGKSSSNENSSAGASSSGQTVPLYKNGKQYNIPANLMQQALKEGFTS